MRHHRSGMVIETVHETVRVFQTNNNNNSEYIMRQANLEELDI